MYNTNGYEKRQHKREQKKTRTRADLVSNLKKTFILVILSMCNQKNCPKTRSLVMITLQEND